MMTLEVLISCMHQKDHSIIERTNIQSDVIVVNQCDTDKYEEWTFTNKNGEKCRAIFISTTERGLSKSRNMAIQYATDDICLFCDDDECFVDNYQQIITQSYQNNKNANFIAFNMKDRYRTFPNKCKKIGFIQSLKIASWQISFRRIDIVSKGIALDESMGAGVTMGGGEENKFLIDCLKKGLKGKYLPNLIGNVSQESSTWDLTPSNCQKYFNDRGEAYGRLMTKPLAVIYIIYSSLKKHSSYSKYMPLLKCIKLQFYGLFNS